MTSVVLLFAVALLIAAPLPARADTVSAAANSGLPGSACTASDGGLTYKAPDSSVSTKYLGAAPAYYEVGMPTGEFAGKRPKAVMLIAHGGGWFIVGKGAVAAYRGGANLWRSRGWMTVNVDYRACQQSITDVLWFMRRIRELHPKAPVCAAGDSAGGHLVLLLAGIRSDLACAIVRGAPTDLDALRTQMSWSNPLGAYNATGAQKLYYWAVAAFGALSSLSIASPSRYASNIRARLLLATGEHDVLVPPEQTRDFAALVQSARPNNYVDAVVLEAGDVPFVHTRISPAAADDFAARVEALIAPVIAGR